jgi:hypothetical protein
VLGEVDEETIAEVGADEAAEEIPLRRRARPPAREDDHEDEQKQALEERHRQAAHAVAEVEGQGQRRRVAEGAVAGAGEQAADAADGDRRRERDRQQVAGAALDPAQPLRPLDREPAAGDCADDRLAGQALERKAVAAPELRRTFEERQEPRAERGAGRRGGDDPPTTRGVQKVTAPPAIAQIEPEADEVGEQFESGVRMEPQSADLQIDREAQNAWTSAARARPIGEVEEEEDSQRQHDPGRSHQLGAGDRARAAGFDAGDGRDGGDEDGEAKPGKPTHGFKP